MLRDAHCYCAYFVVVFAPMHCDQSFPRSWTDDDNTRFCTARQRSSKNTASLSMHQAQENMSDMASLFERCDFLGRNSCYCLVVCKNCAVHRVRQNRYDSTSVSVNCCSAHIQVQGSGAFIGARLVMVVMKN